MPVIRDIQFFKALSPLSRPIADSTHQIEHIAFLVARLELDTGMVGESYLLAFDYSPAAIAGALGDVRAMALGWEVCQTGRFLMEFERQAEYFGLSGIHRWAEGLVNLAMWDAWGKTVGQPIGGCSASIATACRCTAAAVGSRTASTNCWPRLAITFGAASAR